MKMLYDPSESQPSNSNHQQQQRTATMPFSTPPPAPPLSHNNISSESSSRKTPSAKTPKSSNKISNTGALLDQYQDDDDLTTNLLHAIRSWNLQRSHDDDHNAYSSPTCSQNNHPSPSFSNGSNSSSIQPHHLTHCNLNNGNSSSTIGTTISTSASATSGIDTINNELETATYSMTSTSSTIQSTSCKPSSSQLDHHTTPLNTTNNNNNHHYRRSPTGESSCNSSTVTNGSSTSNNTHGSFNNNSSSSAVKKTPKFRGNYSSRPSGLTARILLEGGHDDDVHENENRYDDTLSRSSPIGVGVHDKADNTNVYNKEGNEREHEENEQEQQQDVHNTTALKMQKNHMIINPTTKSNQDKRQQRAEKGKEEPIITQSTTSAEPQQNHNNNANNNNANQNIHQQINSMAILQEAAITLGMNPQTDLDKVLPTIKKLARVVMVHVPNMEQFVDDVCQIVLSSDSASTPTDTMDSTRTTDGQEDTAFNTITTADGFKSRVEFESANDHISNTPTKQLQGKRKEHASKSITHESSTSSSKQMKGKQPKRKNIQARKNQMDKAVFILRNDWQQKQIQHSNYHHQQQEIKSINNSNDEIATSSRRALQKVNMNNLELREGKNSTTTTTSIASAFDNNKDENQTVKVENKNSSSSLPFVPTTTFDDSSKKKKYESFYDNVMEKLQHANPINIKRGANNSSNNHDEQALQIIAYLIQSQADASAFRRYVSHFMHLFPVRHEDIMGKMNDLYVFNNDASDLIGHLKLVLGLDDNCTLNELTMRVVGVLKNVQGNKGHDTSNNDKSVSLVQQQPWGNKHRVTFNEYVEEIS